MITNLFACRMAETILNLGNKVPIEDLIQTKCLDVDVTKDDVFEGVKFLIAHNLIVDELGNIVFSASKFYGEVDDGYNPINGQIISINPKFQKIHYVYESHLDHLDKIPFSKFLNENF